VNKGVSKTHTSRLKEQLAEAAAQALADLHRATLEGVSGGCAFGMQIRSLDGLVSRRLKRLDSLPGDVGDEFLVTTAQGKLYDIWRPTNGAAVVWICLGRDSSRRRALRDGGTRNRILAMVAYAYPPVASSRSTKERKFA